MTWLPLQLLQYTAKLLIPFLNWRARVAGSPHSAAAVSLARLAAKLGDSRTLWRLWGLPPIVAWASAIERTPTRSRAIQTIERLQALAMMIYHPLEHTSYLAAHKIIRLPRTLPFSSQKTPLNVQAVIRRLAIWSTRAWAVYVMLQLIRLRLEWRILCAQGRKAKKRCKREFGCGGYAEAERRICKEKRGASR